MSHLTPDQLSAMLDQRLDARTLERAELHLRECGACRDTLADLSAQDAALARSLDHDPGDAYFESFASRVGDRLRAGTLSAAQERHAGPLSALFRSPRRLTLVGVAAAVVVGAGIVLMSVKETEFPRMPSKSIEMSQRAPESSAPAPPATMAAPNVAPPQKMAADGEVGGRSKDAGAKEGQVGQTFARAPEEAKRQRDERSSIQNLPPAEALEKAADKPAPLSPPVRLREVRKNEAGEEVLVPNAELDRLRAQQKPAAPVPAPAGQPVRVPKQTRATPMRETQNLTEQQFRPDDAKLKTQSSNLHNQQNQMMVVPEAVAGSVCGAVRDPLGRAVAGAQVVVRETGAGTTTDAQGHFCVSASAGTRTLAVMAVGYRTAEMSVQVDAGEQYASIQIVPVNPAGTLGDVTRGFVAQPKSSEGAPAGGLSMRGGRADNAKVLIDTEHIPPAARTALDEARRLGGISGRVNTAAAGQAAAQAWERAASLLPQGAALRDARFEAARERYAVWQRGPSAQAADVAATAVKRFLEVEPAGARRTLVEGWLRTLGR